jgi:PAS domain-containing protein
VAGFDVNATPIEGGWVYHAVNIDAVIEAEIAQRNFVQTLAKTFAQLSIGLAIFDRNGRLALFNPALVDLTGLPAEFLSSRPELLSFFDRLRDKRVMPEPKNYASWRHDTAQMIAAASDDMYQETWNLENGQTYRITGRPHPDKAVAFLIEDISAQVSMTRSYRADLETSRAVFNSLPNGIAVFSNDGALVMCNSSCKDLWQIDPDMSFAKMTITDCIDTWRSQVRNPDALNTLLDFVMSVHDRPELCLSLTKHSGEEVNMHLSTANGGVRIVHFALVAMSAQNTR